MTPEEQKAFRQQRCYEQCKFHALGRVLFSDLPEVKGAMLADFLLANPSQLLVANQQIEVKAA